MSKKRAINIDDLFRIKLLDSPFISSDGEKVAFTLKWVDLKKNKYFSNIYVANTKSKKISRFTWGENSDRRAKWSPDMKFISFLSNRGGKTGLWLMPSDGGEPYSITEEDGSFSFYGWSHNSKYIAYSFKKKWKSEEDNGEEKDKGPDYYIIDEIQFKADGQGVITGDKYHIFLLNVETGEVKQITDGNYNDTNPVFSPDDKFIAFSSSRSQDPIEDPENDDILAVNLETLETRQITSQRGTKSALNWSPHGKEIIFLGNHADIGYGWIRNLSVSSVPFEGGEDKKLSLDFDFDTSCKIVGDLQEFAFGPSSSPQYFENGKKIAFIASVKGACELYSIPSGGGIPEKLHGGKIEVTSFHINKEGNSIAFISGDMTHPHELFHMKKDGKKWTVNKLTDFNDFIEKEITLTEPEDIWLKNSDGVDIHGWLLKPPDFDENKKYPLIQQIHGGPHCLYGYTFFHEMHLLAAKGYCVLYINPRGSQGYGDSYTDVICTHWGEPDYKDQLEFNELIGSKKFIDREKMYLAGGSYGGYMTILLLSKTDRFKAAIAERSVTNMTTLFGVSDYGYCFRFAVDSLFWENPERYNKYSPLYQAKNINTPLLIIHSEGDYRTPVDQADQLFTIMKFLRKKVKYIRFTGESHGLSRCGKPTNRENRLKFILDWLEENK